VDEREDRATRDPVLIGGRYEVGPELGRGGMAKVFRGTDTVLGRPVAVKVLAPQFSEDPAFVDRFRREAQAAARLNHPNLVSVFDTGSDDGIHYIVMEFVDGKTLADYLSGGGRIMPQRAIEIADAVARALEAAHAQGVIHRDIKPGNIMITPTGEVKVTDFGIARVVAGADTVAQTAAVLGTASYLSPEQAQGQPVDRRSDLYSLGCVLYEMLTGRPPFLWDSPVAVASRHVLEQPVPPSRLNPDVGPGLDAVVMRSLAKNPANRYDSAEEFRRDLERAGRGEPVEATPLLPAAATTQVIQRPTSSETMVLEPTHPGRSRWWVWVVVLGLLAILGVFLFFLAKNLLRPAPAVQVAVPNVVNQKLADAKRILEAKGFQVPDSAITRVTDPSKAPGTVTAQAPTAGTRAAKNSTVHLTVVKAPATVTIPPVAGLTADEAQSTLEHLGFVVDRTEEASSTVDPDHVIRTEPAEGTDQPHGSTVKLVVSSGPGTVTVPDVTCSSFGSASNVLRKDGLNPIIESGQPKPTNPLCPNGNKVAAQDPAANTQVQRGSDVHLYPGGASPSPSGASGATGASG
jgi:eukaryotic-like serine/threonine-protein kinase